MGLNKFFFATFGFVFFVNVTGVCGASKAEQYIPKLMSIRSRVSNFSYKATRAIYTKNEAEVPSENDVFERVKMGSKQGDIRFGKSITFVDTEKHRVVYAKKGGDMSEQNYSGDIELEPEDRLLMLLSKQIKFLQVVTENSSLVTFMTEDSKVATETIKITFVKNPLSIQEATVSNLKTGLTVLFTQEGQVDKGFFIPTIQTAMVFKEGVFFRKIVTTYSKFVIDPDEDKLKFSIEKIKEKIRGGVKND